LGRINTEVEKRSNEILAIDVFPAVVILDPSPPPIVFVLSIVFLGPELLPTVLVLSIMVLGPELLLSRQPISSLTIVVVTHPGQRPPPCHPIACPAVATQVDPALGQQLPGSPQLMLR
jgi:hypothetical protein